MKKPSIILVALVLLFASCAKNLQIEVVDNRKSALTEPLYYWVNNGTNETLKDVEFSINDTYFYKTDVSTDGESLDLFEFADKTGKRFNLLETKPIMLKARSKQGVYTISFEDIPTDFEVPEGYVKQTEILSWLELEPFETVCADGGAVSITIICGVPNTDFTEAQIKEIEETFKAVLASKTEPDFEVFNERNLQIELKKALNPSFNVKDVRFMSMEYN